MRFQVNPLVISYTSEGGNHSSHSSFLDNCRQPRETFLNRCWLEIPFVTRRISGKRSDAAILCHHMKATIINLIIRTVVKSQISGIIMIYYAASLAQLLPLVRQSRSPALLNKSLGFVGFATRTRKAIEMLFFNFYYLHGWSFLFWRALKSIYHHKFAVARICGISIEIQRIAEEKSGIKTNWMSPRQSVDVDDESVRRGAVTGKLQKIIQWRRSWRWMEIYIQEKTFKLIKFRHVSSAHRPSSIGTTTTTAVDDN